MLFLLHLSHCYADASVERRLDDVFHYACFKLLGRFIHESGTAANTLVWIYRLT